jgi:hypothetical protein
MWCDHGVTLEIKGLPLCHTWSLVNPTLEPREDEMATHSRFKSSSTGNIIMACKLKFG